MTWTNFYFFCFVVGFLWALVSFLVGSLHFNVHFHGHGGLHHGGLHHGSSHSAQEGVSPFNLSSAAAFLAWFGGAGFLLTAYSRMWFFWGLCFALGSGFLGAAIIYWFLAKVLASREQDLDPVDYQMVGVLGHVSSPIRAGGTGEIVFSQEGVRRTCGARSDKATPIPKGAEVVVTSFEKGIAYVRLWDELNQTPPMTDDLSA